MRSSRRASGPTATRWKSGTTSSPIRPSAARPYGWLSGPSRRSSANAMSGSSRSAAWGSLCGAGRAARGVQGEIVDRFHTLVQPCRPITPGASAIHGYTDGDVRDARTFAEVWPEFRAFVGDDILIAHNGQRFDIPVLRRLAAGRDGLDGLVFYDTLPLVRSLSRDSAKLEDLALRFGIDRGRAHHALDDAVTLARVYRELERLRAVRARKAVLVNLLDYLGLAFALESERERGAGRG